MLKEMLKESPRDTTREYNILLNACAKARKWKHAQLVFEVRFRTAYCAQICVRVRAATNHGSKT